MDRIDIGFNTEKGRIEHRKKESLTSIISLWNLQKNCHLQTLTLSHLQPFIATFSYFCKPPPNYPPQSNSPWKPPTNIPPSSHSPPQQPLNLPPQPQLSVQDPSTTRNKKNSDQDADLNNIGDLKAHGLQDVGITGNTSSSAQQPNLCDDTLETKKLSHTRSNSTNADGLAHSDEKLGAASYSRKNQKGFTFQRVSDEYEGR